MGGGYSYQGAAVENSISDNQGVERNRTLVAAKFCSFFIKRPEVRKDMRERPLVYTTRFSMVTTPAWLERFKLVAGGARKRAGFIRDLVNLLYTDKELQDLVHRKLEGMNREKS